VSFRRCGYPRLDVIPNPPWASRAPDARLSCLARRLSSCCGMPPCATAPLAWDDAVTQLFLRSGELRCAGSAARWPAGVQCPGEREREREWKKTQPSKRCRDSCCGHHRGGPIKAQNLVRRRLGPNGSLRNSAVFWSSIGSFRH